MGCGSSQEVKDPNTNTIRSKTNTFGDRKISADIFISLQDGNITSQYEFKQTLGEGAQGCVKLVVHKKTGLWRAMKQLKKKSILTEDEQQLFNEVDILKTLDHPNIVKIHELYQDKLYYYLISEYCEGGELFDRLASERIFTEKKAADYMKQVLSAISYCHDQDIVHRDLKLENMLLESKKPEANLKVIDFGTSRKVHPNEKMKMRIGTLYYMAPEVFNGNYDLKCDVWSCGVIMYILLCGYPPFNGDDIAIRRKIQLGKYSFEEPEWKDVSQGAKELIKKMLIFDPKLRISSAEALQDPWIQTTAPNKPISANILKNLNSFYSTSKLKSAIELFIITQVSTAKEKEELLHQFKAMDANSDGTLSKDELLACYEKKVGQAKAQEIVDEIMKTADMNGSGKIDFTEFLVAAANKEKLISQQRLEQVFKLFDKDGDGKIQRTELQQIMSGLTIDDEQWKNILEECDNDKDGEISLNELVGLMKKLK